MPLHLEDADKVIESALAHARQLGLRVTVAVVDEGSHLVALRRMDGAPPASPAIAQAKGAGAAMFRRDGASMLTVANDRPAFYAAAREVVGVPMVPGPGSVLISRDGGVIGAVGVSGAKPEEDLQCAEAGVKALG